MLIFCIGFSGISPALQWKTGLPAVRGAPLLKAGILNRKFNAGKQAALPSNLPRTQGYGRFQPAAFAPGSRRPAKAGPGTAPRKGVFRHPSKHAFWKLFYAVQKGEPQHIYHYGLACGDGRHGQKKHPGIVRTHVPDGHHWPHDQAI